MSNTTGEYPTCMIQTTDGGYLVGGWLNNVKSSPGLMKIDSSGNVQWTKNYGNDSYTLKISSVIQTADDEYVFAGYIDNDPSGSTSFWLGKVNSVGNMQWERSIEGLGYDSASQLIQASDGGYLIVGEVSVSSNSALLPSLLKTDEDDFTSGSFQATSPTPSVPELSLLAILPLFISMFFVGVISKLRSSTQNFKVHWKQKVK